MKLLAAALLSTIVLTCSAQQRPAITGVAFGRYYAADAAASDHFYNAELGLDPIHVGKATIYPVNDIQWIETVPLTDPALKSRMQAVGFTTRDAAGLAKYLQAKGVALDVPVREGKFAVRDPEGNQVWFVQTGSNKLVAKMKPSQRAVSDRIIHVGYVVKDEDAENKFYRDILGFKPYWRGGRNGQISWVSIQVPDGTDWIEYMLHIPETASLKQVGVQDHVALGTVAMSTVDAKLVANNCTDAASCGKTQMGADGKVQRNLYDPDLTRVEMMEFAPSGTVCCSPFMGTHPSEKESR